MFFGDWATLGRTVLVGILAYVALIVLLRVSGKRTLSKMNAFDLVITVALGSTLATILLNRDVSLAEGVVALGLLILLQFLITWSAVRSQAIRRISKSEPRLLLHQGKMLPMAMKAERVLEDELEAAARNAGLGSLDDAESIVLETDGSMSVERHQGERPAT